MTKYKLKKDTPLHRAGEIFTKTETTMVASDKYETDTDLIINFDEWFEEVKQPDWKKPKVGDIYYTAYPDGVSVSRTWDGCPLDEDRFSYGACFKTKKAADAWKDYLKAIVTVRQDEGVLTPEQINELEGREGKAYHVGYMGKQNGEEVLCGCLIDLYETWAPVGTILFDTEEHADASRKKHQEEWKVIASYDWSRE